MAQQAISWDDSVSFLAIEVLIWELLRNGTLEPEPLASELERYSRYSDTDGEPLKALARMARHADWSAPIEETRLAPATDDEEEVSR
jgi:hypothetical protein